jgi:hypothetical protein
MGRRDGPGMGEGGLHFKLIPEITTVNNRHQSAIPNLTEKQKNILNLSLIFFFC